MHWRVALDDAEQNPLKGSGAGTYRLVWDQRAAAAADEGHRRALAVPRDAVGTGRGRARARARRDRDDPRRRACCGWAAPSATPTARWSRRARCSRSTPAWTGTGRCRCCSCGCSARAASCWPRAGRGSASWAARRGSSPRWPCSCWRSRRRCSRGRSRRWTVPCAAFAVRDCRTGIDAALDATERFGTRPEPWQILGYCDARAGQFELARRAMDAARSRDPDNWQLAYGQAIVYGVSGLDPRPFAAEALRLNPLDPRARALVRDLAAAKTAARRREVTRRAEIPCRVVTSASRVRRRRIRPPVSRARPPSSTGIAAKPVNGSSARLGRGRGLALGLRAACRSRSPAGVAGLAGVLGRGRGRVLGLGGQDAALAAHVSAGRLILGRGDVSGRRADVGRRGRRRAVLGDGGVVVAAAPETRGPLRRC